MEQSRQNQLVNAILQIGHGDLTRYTQAVLPVEDPPLLAHLIAYVAKHGKVRDTQVALPVLALHAQTAVTYGDPNFARTLTENAIAHLLLLAPRDLKRAAIYHDQLKRAGQPTTGGGGKLLRRSVEQYLRLRERHTAWFTRGAVNDRASLIWLYDHFHVKPAAHAQAILFQQMRPEGTSFDVIAKLRTLPLDTQAALIQQYRLPFKVAVGACSKATEPVILRAIIDSMTPTEVVTNAKMLEKLTANDAACRGAFEQALQRAAKSEKAQVLKANTAAQQVASPVLAERLHAVTEQQIDKQIKPLDCNCLLIADRSGSMHAAVETGKRIAALVARRVTGQVKLVYVNTSPQAFDVGGKTLAQIESLTAGVFANGGTSLGCGLAYATQQKFAAEMALVITDGEENAVPMFADAYRQYERTLGMTPTLTMIRLPGGSDVLTDHLTQAGIAMTRYEFTSNAVDSYNLVEIVNALRPGAYGLLTEVLDTPLLTIAQALKQSERQYA